MGVSRLLYQSVLWRGLYYLSAFVVNILIARHFEAAVSGTIYYISSIYTLVLLFLSFSIESGITFFAAKNEIAVGKLLNFSLLWSMLAGVITLCFILAFVPGPFRGIDRQLLLLSSTCSVAGFLLSSYCTGLFYAKNDFVLPNLLSIGINIMLVLVLPFNGHSLITGISNENYFYVYFSSILLQGIVMAIAIRLKYVNGLFRGFPTMPEFRLLFRYCAMAYLANVIFFFLYRIDYWFVERYCSPDELGNYIQLSKLAQLFFILPTILAGAVFPLTAGGQKENINRVLAMLSRTIFLLYVMLCLFAGLTGKWLFPFVFGESFSGMYHPFLLLIPGILSLSGLFVLTAYYAGKDRMRVNINGSLLALAVIITGDSIFIPRYGINAAAAVSSIGYIVYQVYVLMVFRKEYSASLSSFFLFKISDWQDIKNIITGSFKK